MKASRRPVASLRVKKCFSNQAYVESSDEKQRHRHGDTETKDSE